jgi:hypothetical protein
MSRAPKDDSSNELFPREMLAWMENEISLATKALELRLKDVTSIGRAYVRGDITAEQALQRQADYQDRWHDALPGVFSVEGVSDSAILQKVDETRRPDYVQRLLQNPPGSAAQTRDKPDTQQR